MIKKVNLYERRKFHFNLYITGYYSKFNLLNIILSNHHENNIAAEAPQDPVKVETLLLKICHKKRKDVSSPIMQVSIILQVSFIIS